MQSGWQVVLIRNDGSLHEVENLFDSEMAATFAAMATCLLPGEYGAWTVLKVEMPSGKLN